MSEESVRQLATPSNLRLGNEIVEHGEVEFTIYEPHKIVAKVKNGQRRTVELDMTTEGLSRKCTCTSRKDLFCKHLVAASLKAISR